MTTTNESTATGAILQPTADEWPDDSLLEAIDFALCLLLAKAQDHIDAAKEATSESSRDWNRREAAQCLRRAERFRTLMRAF